MDVDEETLGGGEMHAGTSGVVDHLARDDAHAIDIARGIVGDLGNAGKREIQVRDFSFGPFVASIGLNNVSLVARPHPDTPALSRP